MPGRSSRRFGVARPEDCSDSLPGAPIGVATSSAHGAPHFADNSVSGVFKWRASVGTGSPNPQLWFHVILGGGL